MRSSLLILGLTLAIAAACAPADGTGTAAPSTAPAANVSACAAPMPGTSAAPEDVLDATKALMGALDDDQRSALAGPGLSLHSLGAVQRAAVLGVLKAGLSDRDYRQLADAGIDGYRVRVLGTPSAGGAWTVQVGGAGGVLDFTVSEGIVTTSCYGAAGWSS
ncbi:DUF3500 domain-containing protein [Dactylosporangium sp. CA-052675]|uniref:DUF3500 domain-containing protein n=1 Tax=Dactylosporangium sp. CA-052675 TaxID=3239927 RepID=UPI003D8AF2DD